MFFLFYSNIILRCYLANFGISLYYLTLISAAKLTSSVTTTCTINGPTNENIELVVFVIACNTPAKRGDKSIWLTPGPPVMAPRANPITPNIRTDQTVALLGRKHKTPKPRDEIKQSEKRIL